MYFDSPSLDLYNGRIARIEGAKLVRVRWYGEQPKGDGIVFLELKTHHESWVAERSSKQRVAVQEKDMVHVTSSHKTWSMDLAESIVRSASPKSDGKDLSSATELLHQIHELFAELDLRPCVRTCYRRAAFQSSSSNDLRLTIDRDVIVTDETKAPIGAWCLPNETAVKLAATSSVPGAILEVKLNGRNQPASLERLIESGAVRDGYKFSKFLTSVATFHSDRLAILPYWAKDPMFENMFHPGEPSAVQKILCTRTFSNALDGNSESTLSTTAEVNEEPFFRSRGRRSTWIPASRRSKQRKSLAPSKRVKIEVRIKSLERTNA